MEKIFYAERSKYPTSESAVKTILNKYFGYETADILRTDNGKPYLNGENKLFFSVSHTDDTIFIAFSDKNIGLDAEPKNRKVDFMPIVKKFSALEQSEIATSTDFLKNFTAKESAVKFFGGKLAIDLKYLQVIGNEIIYKGNPLSATLSYPKAEEFIIAVVCENDFSNAELIPL